MIPCARRQRSERRRAFSRRLTFPVLFQAFSQSYATASAPSPCQQSFPARILSDAKSSLSLTKHGATVAMIIARWLWRVASWFAAVHLENKHCAELMLEARLNAEMINRGAAQRRE
jgi:hypothetical protein